MNGLIRRPEEILAYRSLQRVLESKPRDLWTVGPTDSVLIALQIMAEKDIGFLVVLEDGALVGVVSERDCARRVTMAEKSPRSTLIGDIMIRQVVTAESTFTFADCLRLMHQRRGCGRRSRQAHRCGLDPRPFERGCRAPRQDHCRTGTRASDHFHVNGLRSRRATRKSQEQPSQEQSS